MLPPRYPGTGLPGGGRWPVAPSLWRTGPEAGGGSGGEERVCAGRGRGSRSGKGVAGAGKTCTCLDAGGKGESEGG